MSAGRTTHPSGGIPVSRSRGPAPQRAATPAMARDGRVRCRRLVADSDAGGRRHAERGGRAPQKSCWPTTVKPFRRRFWSRSRRAPCRSFVVTMSSGCPPALDAGLDFGHASVCARAMRFPFVERAWHPDDLVDVPLGPACRTPVSSGDPSRGQWAVRHRGRATPGPSPLLGKYRWICIGSTRGRT